MRTYAVGILRLNLLTGQADDASMKAEAAQTISEGSWWTLKGAPIPNATISGTRNGAEVVTSKTNARGDFSFDELGAGHCDFKPIQPAPIAIPIERKMPRGGFAKEKGR